MTARARRRRSRFTPRRWLPFVALCALVAGAAVVEADTPSLSPEQLDRSLDVASLATVTASDALSTAWYCSGGTASGADGIAELSIVLANDAPQGATAEVTFVTEAAKGATDAQVVDVPAHGRARAIAHDAVKADWVGALVEVRGGRVAVDREVTGPLGFDASPCSTAAADDWFVASGTTVRGAEQYLSLFNPFPDTASVDVSFSTESGPRSPRPLQGLSIPGRTVRVIKVGDLVTDRAQLAARVRARVGRVVVDRVQTYDGTGDPVTSAGDSEITTPAPKGLVSTAASPVRAPRWVIPGTRVGEGVRTTIGVFNPGAETAEVDVVLHYQDPKLHDPLAPVELTIRPHRQAVVDVNAIEGIEPDTDLWVDVQSLDGQPIVAERTTSFGDPSPRIGVATTLGSPVAATRWMVTQGGATKSRTGSVQVANPGATKAHLRVFILDRNDRRELTGAEVTVAASDRATLERAEAGAASTVIVEASAPVVVGSSLALLDGRGVSVQPAFAYPETLEALPATS